MKEKKQKLARHLDKGNLITGKMKRDETKCCEEKDEKEHRETTKGE